MPAKIDRCVKQLIKQGIHKKEAYAICSDSTGYKKKRNSGWIKQGRRLK